MIRARGVVKAFGLKPVLRGLDFDVPQGSFVALLGPNGAGKTTFLRILTSLAKPTAGVVEIAGYRIPGQEAAARSLLGVVAHQPLLYGDLTAEENLRFYARMYAVAGVADRIQEVLRIVGLTRARHELVRAFSRGMQQRLAIARAILHSPQVLLLDEPHTGLDQEAAETLDELLENLAQAGSTIVMTSHDLPRAARLAERLDILSRGVIAASVAREQTSAAELIDLYRQVTHG